MEDTFNTKATKLLQVNAAKQSEIEQLSRKIAELKSNFQVEKGELEVQENSQNILIFQV
jgi:hypothetical protein